MLMRGRPSVLRHLFDCQPHFAADATQVLSSGDEEVKLIPVAWSGMSPRDLMALFRFEVYVGRSQIMMAAQFEQFLSILVHFVYAILAEAGMVYDTASSTVALKSSSRCSPSVLGVVDLASWKP
ncbi:hypothetical protein ElyMa_003708300 [Elysia marginata]|uniref:Uncharacterized protein n=1 Tax=Elysia marginata TaxID=1093978 RepID=A0AAV4F3B3_9GAST|nr:hypothetical protein ElyMa_003708300 [Elysia marginata]